MTVASILPPNATALERALEQVAGRRLASYAVPFRDLWSAENCPEALLPWLAWGLSIDQWDASWTLQVRRARVGAAIAVQRIKGTLQSVEDVVASFGGQVVMSEWWQQIPRGVPHTFKLDATISNQGDAPPSAEFIDAVIAEVRRTKPARSHFTFNVGVPGLGRIGLRSVGRALTYARITCSAPAA